MFWKKEKFDSSSWKTVYCKRSWYWRTIQNLDLKNLEIIMLISFFFEDDFFEALCFSFSQATIEINFLLEKKTVFLDSGLVSLNNLIFRFLKSEMPSALEKTIFFQISLRTKLLGYLFSFLTKMILQKGDWLYFMKYFETKDFQFFTITIFANFFFEKCDVLKNRFFLCTS